MVKTKGGGEQLKDDDNHALRSKGPPQNHSRPRCRFPRYSRSMFPGPPRKGVLMDSFYKDPEYIPILEDEDMKESSQQYADAALSYLREQGDDYKLVMLDFYEGGIVGGGARFHHNFTAKRVGVPRAPTETFFSQIDEIIVAANIAPNMSITLQKVVPGFGWARTIP